MNFLQKILPWIGAAASGNVPALVTMAASTVGKALGKDVKADPESIAAAVAGATPDQLLSLKKEDDDFAYKMKSLGFETVESLLKVDADDRANARAMQVQTRSWVVPALACIFVVGFFTVIGLKVGHIITSADQTINDLITTLRDGLILILSYYFGSSAGSAAKTELLAQAPSIQGDK